VGPRRAALVAGLVALTGPLIGVLPTSPAPARAADADTRPNIVVLMADDMRTADMKYLPRTRRLIGELGLRFPASISPHPLCCPARAELLTAQYAQNNGVRANRLEYGGYHRLGTDATIGTWLSAAGYQTALLGKHLNGYSWAKHGRDPGWSRFGPLVSKVYNYKHFHVVEDDVVVTKAEYLTDYLAARTARTVRGFSADPEGRPFFLWVAHVAPHLTQSPACRCWTGPPPAPRHRDLYANEPLDTRSKPSFLEPNIADKPELIRRGPDTWINTRREFVDLFRSRIRSLAALDEANATVLRALRRAGELENTVVVFTSDNGYMLGEHRWTEKTLAYEESLRVPLQIRGPGVPVDASTAETVTTVDLSTTLLRLAGAEPTLPSDGADLSPLLTDPEGAHLDRDTVLVQGGPRTEEEVPWGWLYRGVRTERYTYVRYGNGELELYDRLQDPFQLSNVAGAPAYAEVLSELDRRVDALVDCVGRDCNRTFGPVPDPG